jgi:hypothetical protein
MAQLGHAQAAIEAATADKKELKTALQHAEHQLQLTQQQVARVLNAVYIQESCLLYMSYNVVRRLHLYSMPCTYMSHVSYI